VCEDDVPVHEKRRKEFERSLVLFGVLAAVVVILLVLTIIMSGHLDFFALLSAILIGLFILLFAIVFKYAPALDRGPGEGPKVGKPKLPEALADMESKGKPAPGAKSGKKG
jgi:Ca2+/Na+ antiporter